MKTIKINGREVRFVCDSITVSDHGSGRWRVAYDGRSFDVIGGRASGGTNREWFCYHPEFYGEAWLPATSMVEAIRLGVQY